MDINDELQFTITPEYKKLLYFDDVLIDNRQGLKNKSLSKRFQFGLMERNFVYRNCWNVTSYLNTSGQEY